MRHLYEWAKGYYLLALSVGVPSSKLLKRSFFFLFFKFLNRCLAMCDNCREALASRSAAIKHFCPCCRQTWVFFFFRSSSETIMMMIIMIIIIIWPFYSEWKVTRGFIFLRTSKLLNKTFLLCVIKLTIIVNCTYEWGLNLKAVEI